MAKTSLDSSSDKKTAARKNTMQNASSAKKYNNDAGKSPKMTASGPSEIEELETVTKPEYTASNKGIPTDPVKSQASAESNNQENHPLLLQSEPLLKGINAPLPDNYPYKSRLSRGRYEARKKELQIELLKVQNWVKDTGQRVLCIFEGRDAAGKGGTIKRFTEHLNPRGSRVVALEKPNAEELGQWYFQRYVEQLPTSGEMVFFDRSWYNRAGVEKVMGFCTPAQYMEFMRQVPEFERMLVRSGITVFKYWFSVSREEQKRRFRARQTDPLKQWKLSPIDIESLGRWDDYSEAKESMFFYTHTADAAWTVVRSDDKKRARLDCMRHFLTHLPYPGRNEKIHMTPDPLLVGPADTFYETLEDYDPKMQYKVT